MFVEKLNNKDEKYQYYTHDFMKNKNTLETRKTLANITEYLM